MMVPNYISGFIGGVVSPMLYGRVDDPLYGHAAEKLDNFIVTTTGSIKRRSGFRFIKDFSECKNVRLIPFRFASNQTLCLILADSKLFIATAGQLLMNGDQPYSIDSPFTSDHLDGLHFSQNADVVTFTSPSIPPTELRRKGALDWEFRSIATAPTITPPTSLSASASYPDNVISGSTNINDDNYNPDTATMNSVTATYVVTALDADNRESEPSKPVSTKCNYYITGGYVNLSWGAVSGANYYRVYRMVSGVYCFLAQTNVTSIRDEGSTPDSSMTPPKYNAPFKGSAAGRILTISVLDGGSGYRGDSTGQVTSTNVKDGYVLVRGCPCFDVSGDGWSGGGSGTDGDVGHAVMLKYEVVLKISRGGKDIMCSAGGRWHTFYEYPSDAGGASIVHYFGLYARHYEKDSKGQYQFVKFKLPNEHKNFKFDGSEKITFGIWDPEDKRFFVKSIVPHLKTFQDNSGGPSDLELLNNFYAKNKKKVESWIAKNGNISSSEIGGAAVNYDGDVGLLITDSTGTGAGARGIVKNGRIESVVVEAGGSGYVAPQISVKSSYGSGARFGYTLSTASPPEFPSCSCQFDQRRIFAGTAANPVKVFMTATGSQYLMTYHIPQQSDDMIEIVALTNDADIIKHAVAMESLLLFTGSSELRVYTQDGSGLAPDTVAVRAQSYVGANNVQPVVVNSSIVYIAARGGHPRQLTNTAQGYSSDDLGVRCQHLFDYSDIIDLAYSKAPHQLLYCVSSSGDILICTYVPEQRLVAWTECKTNNGNFKRVCCVSEGEEDRLYVIVERTIKGVKKKYLEHMAPLNYSKNDARLFDSYLEGLFTQPQKGVSGLNHLEGEFVYALVDGKLQGPLEVTNGAITLEKEGRHVVVGLPMESFYRSVPMENQSPQTLLKNRGANNVLIRVGEHGLITYRDAYVGTWSELKDTVKTKTQSDNTKVYEAPIARSYNNDFKLEIRTKDAYPLDIYSIRINQSYS